MLVHRVKRGDKGLPATDSCVTGKRRQCSSTQHGPTFSRWRERERARVRTCSLSLSSPPPSFLAQSLRGKRCSAPLAEAQGAATHSDYRSNGQSASRRELWRPSRAQAGGVWVERLLNVNHIAQALLVGRVQLLVHLVDVFGAHDLDIGEDLMLMAEVDHGLRGLNAADARALDFGLSHDKGVNDDCAREPRVQAKDDVLAALGHEVGVGVVVVLRRDGVEDQVK